MNARTAGPGEFEARLASAANVPVFVRLAAGHLLIEGGDRAPIHDVYVDDVVEIARRGSRIEVTRRQDSPLALDCERAEQLDAALVAGCCTIPELTRALRSLGSSHARAGGSAQREFFAPLLEARRRAEESVGRAGIVRAFDPERLTHALDAYLARLTERYADPRPAARRAFAARAEEAAEPVRAAIADVARAAGAAADPPAGERVASWRRWSASLHALFAAADRCWDRLQPGVRSEGPDTA